jgi:uncharacterized protein YjeT (DUF2065 family)
MGEILLPALAMVLILEGVLPFVAPDLWRTAFRRMTELPDDQLRIIGLGSMIAGLLLLISK